MKTESMFQDVLRRVRTLASILTIVACVGWLVSGPDAVAQEMCQFDGHPAVGPCDESKGYIWGGECWHDDGCYTQIEACCGREF